jgi:AhpD family alkylhydroperoxidase
VKYAAVEIGCKFVTSRPPKIAPFREPFFGLASSYGDNVRKQFITDYQKCSDIATVPALVALAETEAQKFLSFNQAAERQDGAIPRKYRELIAIGVALTTQCACCLDVHTRYARAHGVTKEELAEAAVVAAAVRAGGTLAHSLMALRMYDEQPD